MSKSSIETSAQPPAIESTLTIAHDARVFSLFDRAVALPPRERRLFIEGQCRQNSAIHRDLSALMTLDSGLGSAPRVGRTRPGPRHAGTPTAVALTPSRIGNYDVSHRIGHGGMGVVYFGQRDPGDAPVAIKVPHATFAATARALFEREAATMRCLDHPGIVSLVEHGVASRDDGPQPYLVTRWIDGLDLRTYGWRHCTSPDDVTRLVARVCDAVHHAHTQGVLHGDLKPSNVLVTASGQPTVIDFGAASRIGTTDRKADDLLMGTLSYMSPERMTVPQEELDARTDVYALGVVLHELLTGRRPYDVVGRSLTDAVRVVREAGRPRLEERDPWVPTRLAQLVERTLSFDRSQRPTTCATLARALRSTLSRRQLAGASGRPHRRAS